MRSLITASVVSARGALAVAGTRVDEGLPNFKETEDAFDHAISDVIDNFKFWLRPCSPPPEFIAQSHTSALGGGAEATPAQEDYGAKPTQAQEGYEKENHTSSAPLRGHEGSAEDGYIIQLDLPVAGPYIPAGSGRPDGTMRYASLVSCHRL